MLTPDVTLALKTLREVALLRIVDVERLMSSIRTPEGKTAHMAQMTEQTVEIPGPWPFHVTYSVESGHPIGTCRHLSVSIDRANRAPSIETVWTVAEIMGFVGEITDCTVWLEELKGHGRAVNIVQAVRQVARSDNAATSIQ